MKYCCPRCLNTNKKDFFYLNGDVVCRKCINFYGESSPFTIINDEGEVK